MVIAWKRLCLAGALALVLWPVAVFAQARSRYQWKAPGIGRISTVGGDFSTHSYGIGGLKRAGAGRTDRYIEQFPYK